VNYIVMLSRPIKVMYVIAWLLMSFLLEFKYGDFSLHSVIFTLFYSALSVFVLILVVSKSNRLGEPDNADAEN
jgi:hypothetical protein